MIPAKQQNKMCGYLIKEQMKQTYNIMEEFGKKIEEYRNDTYCKLLSNIFDDIMIEWMNKYKDYAKVILLNRGIIIEDYQKCHGIFPVYSKLYLNGKLKGKIYWNDTSKRS